MRYQVRQNGTLEILGRAETYAQAITLCDSIQNSHVWDLKHKKNMHSSGGK